MEDFASYEGTSSFLRWWPKVALVDGRRHRGYLLHDGVLYVRGRQSRLRLALNYFGYRVV